MKSTYLFDDSYSDSFNDEDSGSLNDLIKGAASSSLKPIDLSHYEIIEEIARGSYGNIYQIEEKTTGQLFTAKIVKNSKDIKDLKTFYREIEILDQVSKFNCQTLIKYIGYSLKDFSGKSSFTIITEYASNGSLEKMFQLEQTGRAPHQWNNTQKMIITYGIAYGMSILHANKIVHRDLKPGNILLDDYLFPIITDFGLSIKEDELIKAPKALIGTPIYMAPEIFDEKPYNKSVDVYSFSMIVYELFCVRKPFDERISLFELMKKITSGERPKFDDFLPDSYRNLIEKCWSQNPEDRPTFEEIVELLKTDDDFIIDGCDKDDFFDYVDSIESHVNIPDIEIPEKRKETNNKDSDDKDLGDDDSDDKELGDDDDTKYSKNKIKFERIDSIFKEDDEIGGKGDDDDEEEDFGDSFKDDLKDGIKNDKDDLKLDDSNIKDDSKVPKKFRFKKVHIEYPETNELLVDVDPIDLEMYEKLAFLGKGQFGKVYKVKDKKTGQYFASKVNIKKLKLCPPNEVINLTREINVLSKVNSAAILKFIGYSLKDFKNKKKPTILTEFSKNGSLDDIIELQKRGLTPEGWNPTKMLITAYGVAYGMLYLHSKNILHRDLKPANIFYDDYLFPKIGDFGLSKEIGSETDGVSMTYQIGTPAFMSPEILDESKYSKAGDVYAYAILLYEMLTQEIPYEGLNMFQVGQLVTSGGRTDFNIDIPKCYQELIEKCWLKDEEQRPTFEEIVDQLENDDDFIIIDDVDEDEFRKYIKYVKTNKIKDQFQKITVDFDELKRIQENDPTLNISFLELDQFERKKIIKRLDNFKIYEVVNKETKQVCEAKVSTIRITQLSQKDIIHLQREINILSKLDHPSFLKFIGYSPIDFHQQPNPIIVTEMPPNRSLQDLINLERSDEHFDEWTETKKLINIYGISSAMAYLHKNNVIHRNLNPESIFLDDYLFPKIGNFGLLTKIHTLATMTYQTTIGIKGNPSYSSPELLERNEYSKQSDVYAFALIVYEIITLDIPFNNIKNFNNLFNEIVKRKNRPKLNKDIPDCYKQLIELCWSQNPEERPTFEEITSILKNDKKFITDEINKEEFDQYVEFIETSKIDFYAKNQVVKFDDIIKEKKSKTEKQEDDEDEINSKSKTKKADNDELKSKSKSGKADNDELKSKSKSEKVDNDELKSKSKSEKTENDELKSKSKSKIKKTDNLHSDKIKSKSISKNKTKSVEIDDDDDDDFISKSSNRNNDSLMRSVSKSVVNEFDHIYDDLLNKKFIGCIEKEVNDYLLQNSELIRASPISSDYKVIIGKSTTDNDFILIRIFQREQIDNEQINKINSEYKIINNLKHPNIVKSLGFFSGNLKENPTILFEFYSRKIKNVIESIEDIYLITLIYEISHAMMIVHSKKLIHRFLNVENIFVDFENHAKIFDFGNSYLISVSDQIKDSIERPCFLSREILKNEKYDEKVDVFSFGMIMKFILQRGKRPFIKRSQIIEGQKAKIPKAINKISFSIILKCLSHSEEERPSFKAIVSTIKKYNFKLIDGIDDKIPLIKKHLKSIIDKKKEK